HHVVLMTEALLVASGHNARARGTAERVRDVAGGEAHATAGEGIEVRRRNVAAALKAEVGEAQIVGEDEDDVRAARRLGARNPRCGGKRYGPQKVAPVRCHSG